MKKILFVLLSLIPAVVLAQPVSIYQPPTPAAKMNITATPGASANGIAVDEFLNQYVRPYGTIAASVSGTVNILTPVPVFTPAADWPVKIDSAAQTPVPGVIPDVVQSSTIDMTNGSATVDFSCDGLGTVGVQFNRGSETGNVQFNYSIDNVTFTKIYELFYKANSGSPAEINEDTSNPSVANLLNRQYLLDCAGKRTLRISVGTTGTGTALPIVFRGSARPSGLIQNIRPGSTLTSLGKAEDAAAAGGDVGVFALGQRADSIASTAGTTGDFAGIVSDADGRTYVNAFGSDAGHTLQGAIHTPIAALTPIPVFTATASTRYYIQSWACYNTGTTATEVLLLDAGNTGTAVNALDGCWLPSNAINGSDCVHNYPGMPLRGTSATAMSFFTTTTGSAVKCFIRGFTSTN